MKNLTRIVSVGVVCAMLALGLAAQDSGTLRSIAGSRYVVSAKAGGLNLVQGDVSVRLKNSGSTSPLVRGFVLEVGDRVITGRGSRTEILLNPGSYVRLGDNSEFEFITTDLNDLQLKLLKGSAMFEVYAGDDFRVTVVTNTTRFYLIKSGVYRVDVLEDGTSRIEVRKGKAQVGDLNATTLKKARAALVDGDNVSVYKFKRKDRDELESWSRARAKDLARANAQLRRSNIRNSVARGFRSGRWSPYNSFGFWTFSPSIGGYCFLPSRRGWRSPYGFGLKRNIYYGISSIARSLGRSNPSRNTGSNENNATSSKRRSSRKSTSNSSRSTRRSGSTRRRSNSTGSRPRSRARTPRRPAPVRRSAPRRSITPRGSNSGQRLKSSKKSGDQ